MMTVSEVEKLAGGDGSAVSSANCRKESTMDIRYSCNQKDFKRYTTEEMRDEMLITGLYKADEVVAVYSHVDRMVTLGCMPVHETVSIDKGIDVWANFGTHYFLERREIGMFNIGKDSTGIVVADGVKYELGYKDCLYITKGTKEVTFASADPEHPAKFYMVSAPAHCSYETRLIKMADANHRPLGSVETCNKRTINQFITRRAQDLPAEHGHDRAGARLQLEHHAQPHA